MSSNYLWPNSMPYDEINIYDNSQYSDVSETVDTTTIPSDPIAFIPFVSPKGYKNDNELVYLTKTALKKYGVPNFFKYGLSLYLANQYVDGNGSLLGMRVTAKNATHAHVGISANIVLQEVPQVRTVVDSVTNAVKYIPYFKKHGSTDTTLVSFDGITYTYEIPESGDEPSVPESITIDPTAKIGDTEQLLTSVYKVSGTSLVDATNESNILYDLVKYKKIVSRIVSDTISKDDKVSETYTASSRDSLEKAFLNLKYSTIPSDGERTETTIPDPNEDGTIELVEGTVYKVPLFMLYSLPTGLSNYNFSLSKDNTMENYANDVGDSERFYLISLYDGSAKLEPKMSFTFSDYIYSNTSMYAEDVFDENATNVGYIAGKVDVLKSIIKTYAPEGTDVESVDILFGSDRESNGYSFYEIDPNGLNLGGLVQFAEGSMGDFDSADDEVRENAINEALADAYEGQTTDLIFDEVRYPFEFVFQPCSASTLSGKKVCDAIHSLVDIRESTTSCMYVPPTTTYNSARAEKVKTYSDYELAKEYFYVESGMVRDPYTHKKIRMPSVYFNAKAIPRAIKANGYGTPLANKSFYWDGFITNTLLPRSCNSQEYIDNHKANLNTMIEDGNGIANAYEQITAQPITSSLSEINNSITLRKICNICLSMARQKRWSTMDDTDTTEVNKYAEDVKDAVELKLSKAYKTFNIVAEKESVNGAGKNRIHCRIDLTFKGMLKGVSYSIYIL